jgi:protein-L-isoaspartate(D-aspartate) O-methyltransferase
MEDRSEKLRTFFASMICSAANVSGSRVEEAFRAIPREPFAGPGPWMLGSGGHPYVKTPDDDPAFLYQNLLVALDSERGVNIGLPGIHALWLGACDFREGQTVVQIGAGSGYYTAVLAHLVGPFGRVCAYEIDETLAARARDNLYHIPQVEVRQCSSVNADCLRQI